MFDLNNVESLKNQLASIKSQIELAETKLKVYSETDWLTAQAYVSKIKDLDLRYLELDHELQVMVNRETPPAIPLEAMEYSWDINNDQSVS